MDRLDELQALVAIVEGGSLSAAGERLEIATSGVSRRLAALEGRLGVQLIRRTTRAMDLTEAGRDLYQRSVRILQELDEAEQAVVTGTQALSGTLRVATPTSFGLLHMGPALSDFMRRHPDLTVELELDDAHVDLIGRGCDLGVRIADLADSTLNARRLTTAELIVCAAPTYLAKAGEPDHPAKLRNHACLRYANPAPLPWAWRDKAGNTGSETVSGPLTANNGECLMQAAIAGHGIVIEPDFIVHDAIRRGDLQPILRSFSWNSFGVWAVWPASRMLPRRVRAFVDFLAERLGKGSAWQMDPGASSPERERQ